MPITGGPWSGVGAAPAVVAATNRGPRTIRVEISETVRVDAALVLISNYTLTALGASTPRAVVSASRDPSNTTIIIVTVDGDLTVGDSTYTIEVDGVSDLVGNVIGASNVATLSVEPYATAAFPVTIDSAGGRRIEGFLGSIPDGTYVVRFGNASGPACYSGVAGQGSRVIVTGGAFTCYSPQVAAGTYALHLTEDDGSTLTIAAAVIVRVANGWSGAYAARSLFPAKVAAGPRNMGEESS